MLEEVFAQGAGRLAGGRPAAVALGDLVQHPRRRSLLPKRTCGGLGHRGHPPRAGPKLVVIWHLILAKLAHGHVDGTGQQARQSEGRLDHEPARLPLLNAFEPLGPRTRAKLNHLADDVLAAHHPAEDAALAVAHVHLNHVGQRKGQLGTSVDLLDLDPLVHHVLAAERCTDAHAARRQIERRGHRYARGGARGGAHRQQARKRV